MRPEAAHPPDDLEQLLTEEQRLGRLLEAARAQARQEIDAARAATQAADAALDADIAAAQAALATRLEAETAGRLAALDDKSRREIGLYDGLDAARIDALARWIAERVLEGVV